MGGIGEAGGDRLRARIPGSIRRQARLGRGFRAGTLLALASVLAVVVGFVVFLGDAALLALRHGGLAFLLGSSWNAQSETFGAVPAVAGTLLTCGLALLFAVPVGLGVALLSAEIAPRRLRGVLAYFVEMGAMVPSIVYGVWALAVLVPYLHAQVEPALSRNLGPRFGFGGFPSGLDLLAAGAILGVMIVPTVAALGREALLAVPRERRESALALGATRTEAARLAVLGPASTGIVGAIALGLGRALGEAIAVVLVIGNQYGVPSSFLASGTSIASWIVNEWPDAFAPERSALFALGLILFAISFAVNVGARLLLHRRGRSDEDGTPRAGPWQRARRHRLPTAAPGSQPAADWWPRVLRGRAGRIRRRRAVHLVVVLLLVAALGVALYPLASLLHLAVVNGGPAVVRPSFYTEPLPVPCYHNCSLGGIGPPLQGTLLLVGLASLIAVPAGVLAGVYLAEYARGRWREAAGLLVDAMVGIPSILIGLFVFSIFFQLRPYLAESALSGALALSVLMLPIIGRATELALRTVPSSVREAALALGFPRHRVTTRVVLGGARSALITGLLLAVGRAIGETAALLFTVGWSQYGFAGWDQPVSALAPFIYEAFEFVGTPNWIRDAWGAVLLLLLLMLGVSLLARLSLRTGEASAAE